MKWDYHRAEMEFRAMTLRDENGKIPPNALLNAVQQKQQMQFDPRAWPAGVQNRTAGGVQSRTAGIDTNSWTWLGPGNIGGRICSILIHPTATNTMWIGGVDGGVWKTLNGGASWFPLDDFMANLAVMSLVMDPTDPNTIYAGTGEGNNNGDAIRGAGIFKTTDGGSTWTQLSATANSSFYYVNRLAICPTNHLIILAATSTGIWRSTDGGTSWSQRQSSSELDIAFDPTGANCIASGASGHLYYSTDAGVTWTAASGISTSGRIEVAYAASSPNIVYASADISSGEIFVSSDGGQTYTYVSNPAHLSTQGWYDNCIWVDPTNPNLVVVGGTDVYRSTDGGNTWTDIGGYAGSIHPDQHAFLSIPGYNGTTVATLFVGNDGGIFRAGNITTVSSSSGWTKLNNNLGITQFYGAAGNNTSGTIVGGTQDNGTLRDTSAGGTSGWTAMFGGDGGYCAADQSDPNYFYGEYVYLQIHRSSNGGASSSYITSGLGDAGLPNSNGVFEAFAPPDSKTTGGDPDGAGPGGDPDSAANFIAPFILDPNNFNTMLAGGSNLWRSVNVKAATPTWTNIKNGANGSFISAIAVAPGNSDIIWVGHNNGDVYSTTNGTAASPTWTRQDLGAPNLPNRTCTRLTIDPNNANKVYATFGGFNADNVYRTTDGGTTWANIATGLPSAPVRSLVLAPFNSNFIYVGTDVGVFASADGGTTWSVGNEGAANVAVDELFWMNSYLVAATHGRGLFKILVSPTPIINLASATLAAENCPPTNGVIDPGETVTVNFTLTNIVNVTTTNLVVTLLSGSGVIAISGPQNYGALIGGGAAATGAFSLSATGVCGGTITATLQLNDGTNNLGTVSANFPLGLANVSLTQNFDGVTPPSLPAGWSVVWTGAGAAWTTTSGTSDSAPNSAFAPDPSAVSDNSLTSPAFTVNTASAQLTFRHNYNTENTYDGGVLEISTNGATFTDILAAGGSFVTNGYSQTISSSYSNPLANRQAWSGSSGGFITTTVNLPASVAGQSVKLRWRFGSDNGVSSTGWYVDTISLRDGYACCTGGPGYKAALANLVPNAGTLSPTFAFNTYSYTSSVPFKTNSLSLTPTAVDTNATITINGNLVASGMPSTNLNLNVGTNVINAVVISQDTTGTNTYTLTVTRAVGGTNTSLANLVPSAGTLTPTFASGTFSYTDSVSYSATNLTVTPTTTDTNATITVNGNPVASGNPSGAINLNVGTNLITTLVMSEDRSATNTYTLTVIRAVGGTNASLANLVPSAGTLTPTFASGTFSYTDSVTFASGSLTVTPTVTDTNATITVNGSPVASGNPSGAINLNVGTNLITTVVVSEDRSTTNTYTLTVTRAASISRWWDGGSTNNLSTGDGISSGGNGTWDTTLQNWDQGSGQIYVAWDNTTANIAIFGGTAGTVTNTTNITVGGLTFTAAYTITNTSGASLNFATAGTISNSAAVTITPPLTGTGPITKTGTGTLTLNSSNSYTGGTVLNAGTLATTNDFNLGSGGGVIVNGTATWNAGLAVTLVYNRTLTISNGAVLTLATGNSLKTITGVLSGSGSISNTTASGTSTFEFNNSGNTFTGTVNNGYEMRFNSLGDSTNAINLTTGSNNKFTWQGGVNTFASRPFTLNAAGTGIIEQNGSGALTILQNLAITGTAGARALTLQGSNTGTNTFAGNIADGSGSVVSLTKSGAGNWALSGTNTYSGTTVNGFNNPAGAGLIFQGMQALSPNTTLSENHTGGTGGFGIIKLLDDSATPASRSTVNINQLSSNTTHPLQLFVGNNNTANGGNSSGTTTGSTITLGNLNVTQTVTGNTSQALQLTGANSYGLQINNLNINLNSAATTWTYTINPATATTPITIAGNVQQAAGSTGTTTLTLDGTASGNQINGIIKDSADGTPKVLKVTKSSSSTWTLSGTNTYSGATTISAGTLIINGSGQLGGGNYAGNITNNGILNYASSATQILSGVISGTGSMTNAGTGQLLINGNASGLTNVVTVLSNATFGGTGILGSKVIYQNGALAAFTVRPEANDTYNNSNYMTFTNAVYMTNVTVGVAMPTNLGNGIYVLATNYASWTTNGSFSFVTNSGSLGAGGSGVVSVSGKNLVLTVSGIPPTITGATNFVSAFSTTYGTASAAQTYPVTGANLTSSITNTAALGFEVSSDGVNYGSKAMVTNVSGSASGTIYIRLMTNAPAGNYNSSNLVVLTSAGTTSITNTSSSNGNTVNRVTPTVVVTGYSVTYNGSPQTATVTTLAGVNGETGATVGTVNLSGTTHTAASSYPGDPWTFTPTANYTTNNGTVNDVINKATSTWSYSNSGPFAYNGAAQSPTISFSGSTGLRTTNYAGTGSTTYASVTAPTNVGTYYVSNTVAADLNYLGTTNSQAFTIKAPGTFSRVGVSGTALTLNVTNGAPGGTWTLLQSTNVAIPVSQWQTNRTGTYDASGNLATNILNTATNPLEFYLLK